MMAEHIEWTQALGVAFATQQGEVMARIQTLVDVEPSLDSASVFQRLLARAVLVAPSWTVRGGTNEILRSVIARGIR